MERLPADHLTLTGMSYDNTKRLSSNTWRHVAFIEKMRQNGDQAMEMPPFQSHWLMMSDVCKHCDNAPCLEACPTGALFRTEFDTVVVQQDICNGCGYCVPACPFGVIDLNEFDGKAHKCTLCYDRLKGGLEPACAKSCPTNSIQFGELSELHERARARVQSLHAQGATDAYLYGAPARLARPATSASARLLPADRSARGLQSTFASHSRRQEGVAELGVGSLDRARAVRGRVRTSGLGRMR